MRATRPNRTIACLLAVAGVFALSGCGSPEYAWDLEEADVVGSWNSPGPFSTELLIAPDGTFRASAWPSNLNCEGPVAEDAEALEASPAMDLTGTWSLYAGDGDNTQGGWLATLTLTPEEVCGLGETPSASFTASDDDVVSMCFPLDDDPDSYTPSRALGLLKSERDDFTAEDQLCESIR